MTTDSNKKHFSRRKLYLLLTALTWIIWSLICVWGFLNSLLTHINITDEEYVYSNRNYYQLESCEYWPFNEKSWKQETKSEEDISECKEKKKESIVLWRSVEYKETLLWFWSRGILFLLIMFTHLPIFLKSTKE